MSSHIALIISLFVSSTKKIAEKKGSYKKQIDFFLFKNWDIFWPLKTKLGNYVTYLILFMISIHLNIMKQGQKVFHKNVS